jgi:hypothetical protein
MLQKILLVLTVVYPITYVPFEIVNTYLIFSVNFDVPLFEFMDLGVRLIKKMTSCRFRIFCYELILVSTL